MHYTSINSHPHIFSQLSSFQKQLLPGLGNEQKCGSGLFLSGMTQSTTMLSEGRNGTVVQVVAYSNS